MYAIAVRLGPSPLVSASSGAQASRDLVEASMRLRDATFGAQALDGVDHAFLLPREPSLDAALNLGERVVATIAQSNASLGNRPKPVAVGVAIAAHALLANEAQLHALAELALTLRVRVLLAAPQPPTRTSPLRALGHATVGGASLPLHEALAAAPAIERRQKELAEPRFRAALSAWRQGASSEAKAKFRDVLAHAPLDGVALAYAEGLAALAVSG